MELRTRIVVPSIAKYEILNALKYSGEFGNDELVRISNDLDNYQLLEVPLERKNSEATIDIAAKYGTTIYGASYVALGREKELRVYTADEKLLDKTRNLSFVRHIRDYS